MTSVEPLRRQLPGFIHESGEPVGNSEIVALLRTEIRRSLDSTVPEKDGVEHGAV